MTRSQKAMLRRRLIARQRARKAPRRTTSSTAKRIVRRTSVPASVFSSRQIVAIVRKAMVRLRKNPADRMFYINAHRLVYYVGIGLQRSPFGQHYQKLLASGTAGLTKGKTAEEIEKIESYMERVKVRLVHYFNSKLNVPYLKEYEEAVIIDTAVESTLAAIKYEAALEAAEDAAEEELIEEDFSEVEESLELDFFTFPQFVYFVTEGLKAIDEDPETKTKYYVFASAFVEQVEDAIIKSWFGRSYLIQAEDADGETSYSIKDVYQPVVPSNPSWAKSLDERLSYLKQRLLATIAPQVNAFFLKEDQESTILKIIVNDVVENLKVGTDLKSYTGDLEKHVEYFNGLDLDEIQVQAEAKIANLEKMKARMEGLANQVQEQIDGAAGSLLKKKAAIEAYVEKISAQIEAMK